jgi:single-strand DNA-binding protein
VASDLNQCQFIGRLGADPETRYMPDGGAVCNLRLAVGWKTKDKEGCEWVPVVFFGKLAEICSQYLRKGAQVYVSGRFRTRKWQAQDGSDRYSTEIVGENLQMLGGKPADGGSGKASGGRSSAPRSRPPAQSSASGGMPEYPQDFDDSIPF